MAGGGIWDGLEAAKRRSEERLRGPHAVDARYDAGRGRAVTALPAGVEPGLAPRDVERIAGASAEDLRVVEVGTMGLRGALSTPRR